MILSKELARDLNDTIFTVLVSDVESDSMDALAEKLTEKVDEWLNRWLVNIWIGRPIREGS